MRIENVNRWCFVAATALALGGCDSCNETPTDTGAGTLAPASAASAGLTPPKPHAQPRVFQGSAIALAVEGDALFVADEDHNALRVFQLPLDEARGHQTVELDGPPAQVLTMRGQVLVTQRNPSQLRIYPRKGDTLGEPKTIDLPIDAWGIAVDKGQKRAFVTSAWGHRVSAIDLESATVRWSIDTAREPRGIVLHPSQDVAYVSHLTSGDLTKINEVHGDAPSVESIPFPASPLRAPSGKALEAALGYAIALGPSGKRLFAARHAHGALGRASWFGTSTVDVLLTGDHTALAPAHQGNLYVHRSDLANEVRTPDTHANLPTNELAQFPQPRALVYRNKTQSVLVLSEGADRLVELDALALDPTLNALRTYQLGSDYDPNLSIAGRCGAPGGLALSEDETKAWIYCRSTYDVATVELDSFASSDDYEVKPAAIVHFAEDPGGDKLSAGRRLFYNATDPIVSGSVACAGCHPEGRDDANTWHEATFDTPDGRVTNFVGVYENIPDLAETKGVARQTPMLAGRVRANGPYGWRAESKTLTHRIVAGFGLHRWGAIPKHEAVNLDARAGHLLAFLREGLVPPPPLGRELTDVERLGKEIFNHPKTQCAQCHRPQTDLMDFESYPLKQQPPTKGFDADPPEAEFKTPSLLFVGGTAPYLHDGRYQTLDKLIADNGNRMGDTRHLSEEERAALVAYLETL